MFVVDYSCKQQQANKNTRAIDLKEVKDNNDDIPDQDPALHRRMINTPDHLKTRRATHQEEAQDPK